MGGELAGVTRSRSSAASDVYKRKSEVDDCIRQIVDERSEAA